MLITLATTLLLGAQAEFRDLGPTDDFVRPATRNRHGPATDFSMSSWHNPQNADAFPNERLPLSIKAVANDWFKRIVRPENLRDGLKDRLLGARYSKSDVIYVRYERAPNLKLQLSENEVAVAILMKAVDSRSAGNESEITALVRESAGKLFNITVAEWERATIDCKRYPLPQPGGYWRGSVHLDDLGVAVEDMSWKSQIAFETDGDSIAFTIRKWLPGDHPMTGVSGAYLTDPSYVGRFDKPN